MQFICASFFYFDYVKFIFQCFGKSFRTESVSEENGTPLSKRYNSRFVSFELPPVVYETTVNNHILNYLVNINVVKDKFKSKQIFKIG